MAKSRRVSRLRGSHCVETSFVEGKGWTCRDQREGSIAVQARDDGGLDSRDITREDEKQPDSQYVESYS